MSWFCRRRDDSDATPPTPRLVDSAEAALEWIVSTAHHPLRPEVVVLVLTADFIVQSVLVVDDTTSPDDVVEVIGLVVESAAGSGREPTIVVASVRPGVGPLPGDVDRWIELSDLAEGHGCELVEWFVLSEGVAWCPRDVLVEPPRWPAAAGSASDAARSRLVTPARPAGGARAE